MFLSKIKGFKYPDIELVRWFFKNKLDTFKNLKVLEFGSCNGNNLSLFANYDYECIGVDFDEKNIANANYNFENVIKCEKYEFFCDDILNFSKNHKDLQADIFLIPNVINYLTRNDFIRLLKLSKENRMYKKDAS